ncbi:hypothetical protein QVZ41_14455 [Wenyingzhuangia sp. chi5]|uniref:Uncharacterized protein n=1 Tax=Wenyingzhuangia gilva TaxID=3057677 RepID=A0ABT8VVP8_9FLAO|nr:hypothetical protein [Wenyingzhuangia sp. chi5]MDO3696051.1 hypothetical protein [Wenyingzhuangia sp. chi5]
MTKEPTINKLELHYYFDESDSSHTMDAFIRNKCEFELLQIYNEFQRELGIDIKLETEAFEEGGLTELWTLMGKYPNQITILITLIIAAISRIPLKKSSLEKQDLELSIAERKLNIENLKKELNEKESPNHINIDVLNIIIDSNPKILKHVSNYYKQLNNYPKVKKISTTKLDEKKQILEETTYIKRTDFDKFIIENDDLEPTIDENATIEIISPVLKKGKYKWKGIYLKKEKTIDFYMKDKAFKQSVIAEGIEFKNGTFIDCILEISRKINEVGEIIFSSYAVTTVLKKHFENTVVETPQGKKHREIKEAKKNQFNLFEDNSE